MSDNMKIRAQDVRILDGEIQSAKGLTRVTSCDECEDENPLWHLLPLRPNGMLATRT